MTDRVAVFIDGGYMDALSKYGFIGRLDYQKLVQYAVGEDGRLLRAYYYTCMPYMPPQPLETDRIRYARKDGFVGTIRRYPRFEVRLGRLQKIGDEFHQKRVDILLAIELVSLAWRGTIDRAVLIAGDSDFVPAIHQAKDAGIVVQLYYIPGSCNDELLDAVDERCEITTELYNSLLCSY